MCVMLSIAVHFFLEKQERVSKKLLLSYMDCISEQKYDEMYEMIDTQSSRHISREDFKERNSAIYEGIEIQDMKIQITKYNRKERTIRYKSSFDTAAGSVSFENEAAFTDSGEGWKIVWDDSMIFPELGANDTVRVVSTQAKRGQILDRNGRVLAGKGAHHQWGSYRVSWMIKKDRLRNLQSFSELQKKALKRSCQQTG